MEQIAGVIDEIRFEVRGATGCSNLRHGRFPHRFFFCIFLAMFLGQSIAAKV